MKRVCFLLVLFARCVCAQTSPTATQIPDLAVYGGAPAASLDLAQYFSDPVSSDAVRISTSLGELDVNLLPQAAPKTVANFLNYVNSKRYDGSFIHRLVSNFIFQGGGYKFVSDQTQTVPTDPPVQNEFGVSNTRGTLAMAKLSGDPNSATSQWFFNLGDNHANLDNQNGGFTVFGRLADYSLPIMDAIAALPALNAGSPFDQLPVIGYSTSPVKSENLVTVNRIVTIPTIFQSYTAVSDHPEIANPTVKARNLLIQTDAAHLGTAHVTVTATTFAGGSISQSFNVTSSIAPGRPVNISTRLPVQTGDNVLIGGFIITGNSPKRFMVRAIGPSLANSGVMGTLQDPILELHDHTGAIIQTNDNWQQQTDSQNIIDSSIAPNDPRESVILATLPADSYTAIVRGKNDTTGIALVEIYDLDSGPGAIVANISTRGSVQTGDNVLIGGFIVGGSESKKILVRGIGPSLTNSGVANALADPTLEIHDGQGATIDSNDNWQNSAQAQQIQDSTIAPSNPKEAATLDTLAPGNYTAILRGVNNTTGVALVEAYELP